MKISFLLVGLLLLIGLCLWYFFFFDRSFGREIGTTLSVENKVSYEIEVSRTVIEQAMGLSGRESIAPNEGMLFVYDQPRNQSFWMKDMNFPLDFLWIREGEIIGLNADIPHPVANEGKTARLASPGPVDAILEVNAGQIEAHGIQVGDKVQY